MKQIAIITGLIIVCCLLTGVSCFKDKQYYLASFEGKVIDAETKEPIQGAVVLAVYHRSTISIAGSNHYPFDAQETITDANGEFKIRSKTVHSEDVSGKPKGKLMIFKPGYGAFPRHTLSIAVGENKSWPSFGKYIVYEIPKLQTREERDNNIHFSRPNIPNNLMKEFIKSLNVERVYLGYDPFTIDAKEK